MSAEYVRITEALGGTKGVLRKDSGAGGVYVTALDSYIAPDDGRGGEVVEVFDADIYVAPLEYKPLRHLRNPWLYVGLITAGVVGYAIARSRN